MNNYFSIVIDCCNQEKWIGKCIESCINQNYDNFDVILVDALSDDKTFEICKEYDAKFSNLTIYQNDKRVPQIANMLFLTTMSKPGSIIVSVDGDDWLKNNNVLTKLNDVYNQGEVWCTYGMYENYPSGSRAGWVYEYPLFIVSNNGFRDYNWLGTHLRTYRRELFLKINENDFRREDGEWLDTTGDQAFMIPILEMSGHRSKFINDVLYVYNEELDTNDSNSNRLRQVELERYIRSKKKYSPIDAI